jgi:hypothetical protein
LVAGKYSFFELTFSGTQIAIQIKKDWRYFFMFEVNQFAVFTTKYLLLRKNFLQTDIREPKRRPKHLYLD